MSILLTAAQMKAIEDRAMAEGLATGEMLMERAGRGVADAIETRWGKSDKARIVVLAGPGNNGGDGFVVARHLQARGWQTDLLFLGNATRLPSAARTNFDRWTTDNPVTELSEAELERFEGPETIFVDALFGTGLSRPLEGQAFDVQRRLAGLKGAFVRGGLVAVDCPSGLCLDSGRALARKAGAAGQYVPPADLTVTFQSLKLGHVLADGPAYCGQLQVADIGLAGYVEKAAEGRLEGGVDPGAANAFVRLTRPTITSSLAGRLSKPGGWHKYNHGHVVVVAGPAGHGGAARLAARAALRVGAGLVTVAAPLEAVPEHAARLDAVMVRPVADASALEGLVSDKRVSCICIGPALGLDEGAAALVDVALRTCKPIVLDADALTLIARRKSLRALLHGGCVLTPHAGEFARLWPKLDKAMRAVAKTGPAYSKVDAVRAAAAECGARVLLKGPDTVSAHPLGGCWVSGAVYEDAAPWLATAGSGDVLAGFIAGLLARATALPDAAAMAAWLHAACARRFGPGLIAEDLPEQIPEVFRELGV